MAVRIVNFSPASALAAIMRIARDATSDMYTIMKMIYVADKVHFERTGRFMFGDYYASMDYGATPSGAYDLVKFVRGDGADIGFPEAKEFIGVNGVTHEITLLREVRDESLSTLARECLDDVILDHVQNRRNINYWSEKAHDSAWDTARESTGGQTVRMDEREIAKTIPNSDQLLAYLDDPATDRC